MRNITYQVVDDHLHRRIGTSSPANLSASVWLVSRWPSHQSPYGLLQRTRARLSLKIESRCRWGGEPLNSCSLPSGFQRHLEPKLLQATDGLPFNGRSLSLI